MKRLLLIIILLFFCATLNPFAGEDISPALLGVRDVKIEIPEDYGRVVDSFGAGDVDESIVLCIQDAHCHYEAQMNIYHIIKKLDKKFGVRLIAVEGSEGVLDTSPFQVFNDENLVSKTAQYFMERGLVTGPEYFTILKANNPQDYLLLYGIEDRNVYQRNLKAGLSKESGQKES